MRLKNVCNDVEFMHVFMPQVRNIINEKGKIEMQYIGKFENLEEDFCKILKNIGIKNIIHESGKKMNVREHAPYVEYYTPEILNYVNELFKEDFLYLDYPKCNTIEEMSINYKNPNKNNNDSDQLLININY
jgi:hypothetical protein